MKTVKVWICDFYDSFNLDHSFLRFLKNKFNLIMDENNPDIVFYSVFGNKHLKYLDKILIFFTGEPITPDFNVCDYAIGFDYLTFGDRYLRYPLYKFYYKDMKRLTSIKRDNNKKFCCFVVSNDHCMPQRGRMFELLNKYKRVDSGGKFLNNIGHRVEDKFEFQSNYKFCLCFENCIYDGYTTEKIVQAFAAGCIPIYLGNPSIAREFDPKSFVNCHDFASLEDACEYIKKIDNDDKLYNEIISRIKFKDEIFDEKPLEDFLVHIFSQDFKDAKRLPPSSWLWWKANKQPDETIKNDKESRIKRLLKHPIKTVFGKIKRMFKRK